MVDAPVAVKNHALNFLLLGRFGDTVAGPDGLIGHVAFNVGTNGGHIRQRLLLGVVYELSHDVCQRDLYRQAGARGRTEDGGPDTGAAAIQFLL